MPDFLYEKCIANWMGNIYIYSCYGKTIEKYMKNVLKTECKNNFSLWKNVYPKHVFETKMCCWCWWWVYPDIHMSNAGKIKPCMYWRIDGWMNGSKHGLEPREEKTQTKLFETHGHTHRHITLQSFSSSKMLYYYVMQALHHNIDHVIMCSFHVLNHSMYAKHETWNRVSIIELMMQS
jgi:hypothetical protein